MGGRRGWGWFLLLAAATAAAWAWAVFAPYGRYPAPRLVEIPAHSSTWQVARQLRGAGVIRNAPSFELWVLAGSRRTLKAGWYRFDHAEAMPSIARRLERGDVFYRTLVVPEGFNRFDIAHALERAGVVSADAFLAATADAAPVRDLDPQAISLEGFLYPDTYRLPPRISAPEIAGMMVHRFRQVWNQLRPEVSFGNAAGPDSFHEWLTIASLVEKETAQPPERPLIAGVFYNRLRQRVPLQCDPTVLYAAEAAGHPVTGALRAADLRLASPYNTYSHAGLPPGPIANPGRASLVAAAHPAATKFLYFVSNGAGGHRFARTLSEQDRNILLYLQATGRR